MPRRTQPKHETRDDSLDFKIVTRFRPGRVELVRVALHPDQPGALPDKVIKVIRGRLLSRRGPRGKLGMISDTTGQRALEAFRLAVREAKQQ